MAKRKQQPPRAAPPPPPRRPGLDAMAVSTLAAVAIVLFLSVLTLRAVTRVRSDLEDKLARVEDRIAKVADKIASAPAPAAQPPTPPRRGPDPEKVYPIKTAGRPAKGPASAPITIAEFSDFQ